MKLLYTGKTKDVYDALDGTYLLKFKDDVTGSDGVFDPGANQVAFKLEGAGKAALKLTTYFFEILKEKGIPTHYISTDFSQGTMSVKPATVFGNGLEVICRYRAVGSFLRRYGMYAEEGQLLDGYVEFTLKDDERGDPLICKDALVMLGILSPEEYETIKNLTKEIAQIVKDELSKKGLELYDIKFEFGRTGDEKRISLIDEISGGNMRVYKDGKFVEPLELGKIFFEEE